MFQHESAPPHAVQIREFFNERFPARWIGRSGTIIKYGRRFLAIFLYVVWIVIWENS